MADFQELYALMKRLQAEDMFRANAVDDLAILTRSIWVMSRYWMDHLSEFEGLVDISWEDLLRGIEHHLALLLPCLKKSAQDKFRVAVERAIAKQRRFRPAS